MANFSFDIVSDYDKAEMNNVFAAVERDINNRYDFKNTPASIEWMSDKKGFRLVSADEWQNDAILDVVRKRLAARGQSSKALDLTKGVVVANLKATREIPFKQGLSQDDAKTITKDIRENLPKLKSQIQGDLVRVTGSSKDDLQKAISLMKSQDYDFPLEFINFR